jgi:hypothetical protein
MATGRIGTTPVLTTRWSKAPAAGTTSLSGLDDNSVSLVYSVGYEAVYQNGVLLSRGNDYTATNGTTITLTTATVAGDIIEVFANQTIPLTDTYTQTVANGKFINNTLTTTTGDIIYASAANTPARLGIGSTDQVLKVSGGVPVWGAVPNPSFVGCNVKRQGVSTSITGGVDYTVAYTTEQFDTDGFHDNSTNNSRITIPTGKGGKYQLSATINNEGGSPGSYQLLSIKKNGSLYTDGGANTGTYFRTPGGGQNAPIGFSTIVDAAAGDYFEVIYTQANSGTVNIYSNFCVGYLGA